ncbi:hypothetical protein SLE2022_090500 [Rubroshorea leprosula]
MVARLTPDQKVACSIHVGFKTPILPDPSFFHFCISSLLPLVAAQAQAHAQLLGRLFFSLPFNSSPRSVISPPPPIPKAQKKNPPAKGGGQGNSIYFVGGFTKSVLRSISRATTAATSEYPYGREELSALLVAD